MYTFESQFKPAAQVYGIHSFNRHLSTSAVLGPKFRKDKN